MNSLQVFDAAAVSSGAWIHGTVNGFRFSAVAFRTPSSYGMDENPRISKLFLFDGAGCTYCYDRYLDKPPTTPASSRAAAVLAANLLDHLPNL